MLPAPHREAVRMKPGLLKPVATVACEVRSLIRIELGCSGMFEVRNWRRMGKYILDYPVIRRRLFCGRNQVGKSS